MTALSFEILALDEVIMTQQLLVRGLNFLYCFHIFQSRRKDF